MPRPRRRIEHGDMLHVFGHAARDHEMFHTRADRVRFLRLLSIAAERHDVEIVAYCLMGNHYHLMVRCAGGADGVSNMMRDFLSSYVRGFNASHDYNGSLCRDRFSAKRIDSDSYARYVSAYIHFNPRHLGWTRDLAEYRWSSYGAYVGSHRAPDWLRASAVLGLFAGAEHYRSFVEAHDPLRSRPGLDPERLHTRYRRGVGVHAVAQVASALEVSVEELRAGELGALTQRCAALLLADECSFPSSEIGPALGVSISAGRAILYRARRAIEADPSMSRTLDPASAALQRLRGRAVR